LSDGTTETLVSGIAERSPGRERWNRLTDSSTGPRVLYPTCSVTFLPNILIFLIIFLRLIFCPTKGPAIWSGVGALCLQRQLAGSLGRRENSCGGASSQPLLKQSALSLRGRAHEDRALRPRQLSLTVCQMLLESIANLDVAHLAVDVGTDSDRQSPNWVPLSFAGNFVRTRQ